MSVYIMVSWVYKQKNDFFFLYLTTIKFCDQNCTIFSFNWHIQFNTRLYINMQKMKLQKSLPFYSKFLNRYISYYGNPWETPCMGTPSWLDLFLSCWMIATNSKKGKSINDQEFVYTRSTFFIKFKNKSSGFLFSVGQSLQNLHVFYVSNYPIKLHCHSWLTSNWGTVKFVEILEFKNI